MWFLKKLFGGSDPGCRPDSGDGRAFIPSDDSNEQILGCVLSYIWLAEMGEGQRGRELPKNDNVGPRTTGGLKPFNGSDEVAATVTDSWRARSGAPNSFAPITVARLRRRPRSSTG